VLAIASGNRSLLGGEPGGKLAVVSNANARALSCGPKEGIGVVRVLGTIVALAGAIAAVRCDRGARARGGRAELPKHLG
jgi:hypothetical protein